MCELTIAIFTCDAYRDLWEANVNLLEKNFPNDQGFEVIFVTDKKPSHVPVNMLKYKIIWNDNPNDYLDKLSIFLKKCSTEYFYQ